MSYKTISTILIWLAAAVIMTAGGVYYISRHKEFTEADIRTAIMGANHCRIKSDCAPINAKCPFGCNIFVHKNEVERINEMLDVFPSSCVYSCIELRGYDCVSGRCEAAY